MRQQHLGIAAIVCFGMISAGPIASQYVRVYNALCLSRWLLTFPTTTPTITCIASHSYPCIASHSCFPGFRRDCVYPRNKFHWLRRGQHCATTSQSFHRPGYTLSNLQLAIGATSSAPRGRLYYHRIVDTSVTAQHVNIPIPPTQHKIFDPLSKTTKLGIPHTNSVI